MNTIIELSQQTGPAWAVVVVGGATAFSACVTAIAILWRALAKQKDENTQLREAVTARERLLRALQKDKASAIAAAAVAGAAAVTEAEDARWRSEQPTSTAPPGGGAEMSKAEMSKLADRVLSKGAAAASSLMARWSRRLARILAAAEKA